MQLRKRYFAVIGIAILLFILSTINLGEMLSILVKADMAFVALALLLTAVILLAKSAKWAIIVRAFRENISLKDAFQGFTAAFFLSTLTPGRIAELLRAFYLKAGLGKALATVIIDRLIDVILLFSFGFLAVLYFFIAFNKVLVDPLILALIFIAFIAAVLLLLRENFIKAILRPFFNAFVPLSLKEKLHLSFKEFFASIKELRNSKKELILACIAGILIWILSILTAFTLTLALGLQVPIEAVFLAIPIAALLDLAPISFAGLGTREAVMIFVFSLYMISAEQAVAFSLLYFLVGYVSVQLLGFAFFLKNPVKLELN